MDLQPYFDASRNPVTKLDLSLSPLTTLSIPLNFTCQCVPQDPAELALGARGDGHGQFFDGHGDSQSQEAATIVGIPCLSHPRGSSFVDGQTLPR